jgi:hypothetical protein
MRRKCVGNVMMHVVIYCAQPLLPMGNSGAEFQCQSHQIVGQFYQTIHGKKSSCHPLTSVHRKNASDIAENLITGTFIVTKFYQTMQGTKNLTTLSRQIHRKNTSDIVENLITFFS